MENSKYVLLEADVNNIIKSRIFPGFCLDLRALRAAEMTKALALVQQKLNSEQHADVMLHLTL